MYPFACTHDNGWSRTTHQYQGAAAEEAHRDKLSPYAHVCTHANARCKHASMTQVRAEMNSRLKGDDLEKKVRAEMNSRLKGDDLEKKVRAEMDSRLKKKDLEKKVGAEMDSRLKKKDLEKKVRAEMDSRLKGEDLKKAAEVGEHELAKAWPRV